MCGLFMIVFTHIIPLIFPIPKNYSSWYDITSPFIFHYWWEYYTNYYYQYIHYYSTNIPLPTIHPIA